MAEVSVNGWIAEGGHTIIEGKKNNIILFDVVENCGHIGGLPDDKYTTKGTQERFAYQKMVSRQ